MCVWEGGVRATVLLHKGLLPQSSVKQLSQTILACAHTFTQSGPECMHFTQGEQKCLWTLETRKEFSG